MNLEMLCQLSLRDPRLVILSKRKAKDSGTLGRSGIQVSKRAKAI
jgi:hypothetical protein